VNEGVVNIERWPKGLWFGFSSMLGRENWGEGNSGLFGNG